MPPIARTALACALLALSACKPQTPATDASGTAAGPGTADDHLNAVLWMQRSVEYRAAAEQTYRAATERLDAALQDPAWNALVPEERANASATLKPAIVMDVDETVLDNMPYLARLVRSGKEYEAASWDQWVREKKAQAVPGAVDFAKAATAKGITVLYVTNRDVHLNEATLVNLRKVGLPVADNSVLLGLGTVVKDCKQNGSEKHCRRQLVGQQYRVLMQFGDQLGDFVQVLANTTENRTRLLQQYHAWFGSRWWMLPNPSYGSWEPALFNNDLTQPRAARHQAKLDALEVAQ
ncbi:5'-nucleotidase, lipoprotein e(P4) family [Xanthomonas sp. GPE 39]|uniref:5'-nucleotidase, lipoprotein e(P4) family n=1 Tax=Xanthomonas sp. GPE 39 TaxID=1583099 RepID=UPI0005F27EB5|nr:5'-nucleotidase, lipoprotein e(P4) family [Xanthomonas sp. GPE 39]